MKEDNFVRYDGKKLISWNHLFIFRYPNVNTQRHKTSILIVKRQSDIRITEQWLFNNRNVMGGLGRLQKVKEAICLSNSAEWYRGGSRIHGNIFFFNLSHFRIPTIYIYSVFHNILVLSLKIKGVHKISITCEFEQITLLKTFYLVRKYFSTALYWNQPHFKIFISYSCSQVDFKNSKTWGNVIWLIIFYMHCLSSLPSLVDANTNPLWRYSWF